LHVTSPIIQISKFQKVFSDHSSYAVQQHYQRKRILSISNKEESVSAFRKNKIVILFFLNNFSPSKNINRLLSREIILRWEDLSPKSQQHQSLSIYIYIYIYLFENVASLLSAGFLASVIWIWHGVYRFSNPEIPWSPSLPK
jgi:hypothetical protein